jgi:hypothetical protein
LRADLADEMKILVRGEDVGKSMEAMRWPTPNCIVAWPVGTAAKPVPLKEELVVGGDPDAAGSVLGRGRAAPPIPSASSKR